MRRIDPQLDLVIERTTTVAPEQIWRALTDPQELKKWFCPRPWRVVRAEIDLRPGGIFLTEMRGPNGESAGGVEAGCYLEVVPYEKLVWTSCLGPDFRPAPPASPGQIRLTVTILLESRGAETKYTAIARHSDAESRESHEKLGFQDGWGTAFAQMIDLIKTWKI